MVNYTNLLFDLDGTIVDSSKGIIDSVKYALTKMNFQIPEDEKLYSFIGPPLSDSFQQIFQMSEQEVQLAIQLYREYYTDKGIYEVAVYDGVKAALQELKEASCSLYIATSKPEIYAKKIIKHIGFTSVFSDVYGASLDYTRSTKSDVIHYALKESRITKLSETLMIGDREHDILGAQKNGLESVGILYGFGSFEELSDAGATHILKSPSEIVSLIK